MFATVSHDAITRIRYPRSAGIRNQRDRTSAADFFSQLRGLLLFIEVVIGDKRFLNPEVVQQLQGLSRVFAGDEIRSAKSFQRARTDIREIADWRGYNDERAHAVEGCYSLSCFR